MYYGQSSGAGARPRIPLVAFGHSGLLPQTMNPRYYPDRGFKTHVEPAYVDKQVQTRPYTHPNHYER